MQLAIPKSFEELVDDSIIQVYFIEETSETQVLGRRPLEFEVKLKLDVNLRALGDEVVKVTGVDANGDEIQFAILVPGQEKVNSYSIFKLVDSSTSTSSLLMLLGSKKALLGAYKRSGRGSVACILSQVMSFKVFLDYLTNASESSAKTWQQ